MLIFIKLDESVEYLIYCSAIRILSCATKFGIYMNDHKLGSINKS